MKREGLARMICEQYAHGNAKPSDCPFWEAHLDQADKFIRMYGV